MSKQDTVLLLGANGYVGSCFKKFLDKNQIPNTAIGSRSECDYTNKDVLNGLMKVLKPNIVINCAGYTGKPNVDACETEKLNCLRGNSAFPAVLAEMCQNHGSILGHVSSGCIYTGDKNGKGFTEEDTPNFSFRTNNCSFYSGTKALGEELLKQYDNTYIWRLRIPFDNINSPRNYLTKLMTYNTLLNAKNSISELGEFVSCSFKTFLVEAPFGIYNVTNTGHVETEEVVKMLLKYNLPYKGKQFSFFKNEEEFLRNAAKTPRSNCILDNSKLTKLGIYISESYEAVEKSLKNWITN